MTPLETIIAVVVPFVSGGGVWAYLASRQKGRASITHSQAALVSALNAQTETLLAESAKDRKDLKRRIDRQGVKMNRLEKQIAECREKHSHCETNLADVRAEIEKLMQGPVAAYNLGSRTNVAD